MCGILFTLKQIQNPKSFSLSSDLDSRSLLDLLQIYLEASCRFHSQRNTDTGSRSRLELDSTSENCRNTDLQRPYKSVFSLLSLRLRHVDGYCIYLLDLDLDLDLDPQFQIRYLYSKNKQHQQVTETDLQIKTQDLDLQIEILYLIIQAQ